MKVLRRRPAVRPMVAGFAPYAAIEPVEVLAARLGISTDAIVKLDANENPWGPVPAVAKLLARTELASQYPDPHQASARAALATYSGIPAECIVLGNGSDELIDLIMRAMVEPGQRVVSFTPTFSMYRFYADLAGAAFDPIERDDGFDIGPGLAAQADGAALVCIAAPNNPTGTPLRPATLDVLLDSGALLVVDEAYFEFSDNGTAAERLAVHDNVVILRTLSKWAGLAGLRVGYALCPPWLSHELMKIKTPYNVNAVAQQAVVETIADLPTAIQRVEQIRTERPRLIERVEASHLLTAYPTDANFALFQATGGVAAADIHAALARRGIFVRHYQERRLADCLRISVGRKQDTDRLGLALEAIREEHA